jgi:dienelactone hydrolase
MAACNASPDSQPPPPPPPDDYEVLVRLYSYNQTLPLNVQELSVVEQGGVDLHDITYNSPVYDAVPAYLVTPKGTGPYAGMIYVHWGQGNRNEFLSEAVEMAALGTVSVLIDAPFRRGGFVTFSCETYIQTVMDIRRAVDLLESLAIVDRNRIGYVGHSFGATWGGVVAGVEKRIKSFVLIAGLPDVIDHIEWRPGCEDTRLNAVNYIGHAAPSALFFQFANTDEFISREDGNRYYSTASNPKSVTWYDTTHIFICPEAYNDRIQWLSQRLALAPTP